MKILATRARANTTLQANQQRAATDAARRQLANRSTNAPKRPARVAFAGPGSTPAGSSNFARSASSPGGAASTHAAPAGDHGVRFTPVEGHGRPSALASGRVDLRVAYADKDIVKAMGAQWDPVRKTWFVKPGIDPAPFAAWFMPD